ncbi:MAG: hypothetical protein ABR599_12410 [Gemmatimonadota bacterium]
MADRVRRGARTRGILWLAAGVAIVTAVLGVLFWPLWIATIASVGYIVLDLVALKRSA